MLQVSVLFVCLMVSHGDRRVPPNIVVIMADDLGWNDVGYHGSNEIQTPNIDALAYHGIMLERHYVSPTCTPSRSAYYTGKYPMRMGMQGQPISTCEPRGVPLSETLLPQHLHSLGYATHLVGKWHIGLTTYQHMPTYRGFDSFFGFLSGFVGYFDGVHKMRVRGKGIGIDAYRNTEDAWQEFAGNYITDLLTDEAVKIIYDHNTSRPLFLQVMHLATHSGNLEENKLEVRNIKETFTKYEYIKDYNRRLYAGVVEALDDSVGRIVTSLKDKGLLENSIIVFLSDNGAATEDPLWNTNNFGSNWPLRGLKGSLHEGAIHVPALIYSPLLPYSNISRQLFHITDWLPTFYHAAGGDTSKLGPINGVSQWDALRLRKKDNRREFVILDIDEIFKQEAMLHKHWKIIKRDPSPPNKFSNYYYGHSGRDDPIPPYNMTAVISSQVHRALSDGREPNTTHYLHKRHRTLLDSKCKPVIEGNTDHIKPCTNYCLFNVHQDPCETVDLSKKRHRLVNDLVTVLKSYKQFHINKNNFTIDLRGHAKFWNNRWVPWLDVNGKVLKNSIPMLLSNKNNLIFVLVVSSLLSWFCI